MLYYIAVNIGRVCKFIQCWPFFFDPLQEELYPDETRYQPRDQRRHPQLENAYPQGPSLDLFIHVELGWSFLFFTYVFVYEYEYIYNTYSDESGQLVS